MCDKTCIFFFFPIINKYLCMAKRSLLSRCPSYLQIFHRPTYKAADKNIFKKNFLGDMAYKSLSIFTFSIKWFTILTATQASHCLSSLWASYYRNARFIQNPSCFTSDDGPPFFILSFGDVVNFPVSLSFKFYDVSNDARGPIQAFCFFDYQRRIISPSHLLAVFVKFFSTYQQRYFLPQK